MHATLDVAKGCLGETDIALASLPDGGYDTTALAFAILQRAWPELEKVFLLDKLHKVGFARMRLVKPPRRPERKLKEFLNSGELLSILRHYDSEQTDRLRSELQTIIELPGSQVVFIRRPHHQSLVLTDERVVHGFTADQIVLDFRDEAARLNVASHGHAASYDIANRCQRRSNSGPLWRSKSRPFARERRETARGPIGPLAVSSALPRGSGFADFAGLGIDGLGDGLVLLCPIGPGGGTTTSGGLLQAVAVAVHGEDMNVVGQPVEQRAGEPFRSQHRGPVLERQI
jgi:hypothetical protein